MSEEKHFPHRDGRPDLTVGVVAEMVGGVSVRTLHHYDQIGLVTPSRRTAAGYRVYDDADVERLYRVLTHRELGFSLERIATLLDDPDATNCISSGRSMRCSPSGSIACTGWSQRWRR